MEKQITFQNMDPSKIIEEYVDKKIEKFEKLMKHHKNPFLLMFG